MGLMRARQQSLPLRSVGIWTGLDHARMGALTTADAMGQIRQNKESFPGALQ